MRFRFCGIARVVLAAFAAAGFAPQLHAAKVDFYVPVIVDHMPREVSELMIHCTLYALVGASRPAIGGLYQTTVPLTGGSLRGRVVVPVNPRSDIFIEAGTTFVCALRFGGTVELHPWVYVPRTHGRISAFNFWTQSTVLPEGMPLTSWFDGDIGRPFAGYIPYAAGTTLVSRPVTRVETPGQDISLDVLGALNLHGKCECGCGGNFDEGTAACGPGGGGNQIFVPVLPFEPGRDPQLDIPRPGGNLGPKRPTLGNARPHVTQTSSVLVFHGTGALVNCRGTGVIGVECPPMPSWLR